MDVDDETMSRLLKGDVKLDELDGVAQQMFEVIKTAALTLRRCAVDIAGRGRENGAQIPVELFHRHVLPFRTRKLLELRAKDLPEGTLCDMLLASAYLPVFRSEKLGGKRYADGGLRDVLPLHVLIEHGYKDILALRLFGIGVERSVKIPEDTRVYTVEPTADLGSTLEFEPAQSRENLRRIYDSASSTGCAARNTMLTAIGTRRKALSLCRTPPPPGRGVSLRTLCSSRAAKRLDAEKGDYIDLAVALVEPRRSTKGVDPWQIVTADALLEAPAAGRLAAFAEPAARKARPAGRERRGRPRRCWGASGARSCRRPDGGEG